MIRYSHISAIVAIFMFVACSESEFKGSNNVIDPPKGDQPANPAPTGSPVPPTQPELPATPQRVNAAASTESILFGCDGLVQGQALEYGKGRQFKIRGSFCPEFATAKLSVVFVVDVTGSTSQTDQNSASGCGRSQAVANLVDSIITNVQGVYVDMGFVTFGTILQRIGGQRQEIGQHGELVDAGTFQQSLHLQTQKFCTSQGDTFYDVPLQKAHEMLSAATDAHKLLYFISDGLPNGQSNHAGQVAALKSLSDIEINAIFLGTERGRPAMEQIASSPDKVKIAGNAAELANAAKEIVPPKIEPLDGPLNLEVSSPLGTNTYTMTSQKDENGILGFSTDQPIELFSDANGPVQNTIKVTVTKSDGSTAVNEGVITVK